CRCGEHPDRRTAQAAEPEPVDGDGCAAGRRGPCGLAGARGGDYRAAALSAGGESIGREERRQLVAAAGPGRGGRLPDGVSFRRLAVWGTGNRPQRIQEVPLKDPPPGGV